VAAGRLSHTSAGALKDALEGAVDGETGGLVLDFALVDYLSSAALTVMDTVALRLARNGGVLVLCALTEPVRIALELSGLLPHFTVESSRENAVALVIRSRPDL
jgi:anti-anti-sigma factor